MSRAIMVVDVQPDFCEGGPLAVQGGDEVARMIADYLASAGHLYDARAFSQDFHNPPPDDNWGHFALVTEPDYESSWPVHCVAGTAGVELHPAIRDVLTSDDFIVRKGQGVPAYSAAEGSVIQPSRYAGAGIVSVLRAIGVDDVDVCGLAFDFCVRQTAIDLSDAFFNVRVLKDLTASVHPNREGVTLRNLYTRDVRVVEHAVQ